jgi:hypothetical protein
MASREQARYFQFKPYLYFLSSICLDLGTGIPKLVTSHVCLPEIAHTLS